MIASASIVVRALKPSVTSIFETSTVGVVMVVISDSFSYLAPTLLRESVRPAARGCVRKSGVRRAGEDDP